MPSSVYLTLNRSLGSSFKNLSPAQSLEIPHQSSFGSVVGINFKISSNVISLTGFLSGKKYSAIDGLAKNKELNKLNKKAIGSISNPAIQMKPEIIAATKNIPP